MTQNLIEEACLAQVGETGVVHDPCFRNFNLCGDKKLSYLVTLENMFKTYDQLERYDDDTIKTYGKCVNKLVNEIIVKLTNLVTSKRTLTCRNVLIANYETMTNPLHWLNHKLFNDLPNAICKALKKMIVQMVDLINALVMKIFQLEDKYREEFFDKIMKSYVTCQYSKYDLWKARQKRLTIKKLKEYQAELTADMLILGIMKYDETPSDQEMDDVRLDLLKKEMKHSKELPENFKAECAKLKRYSSWSLHKFIINYKLIKKYLFGVFDKLTVEQHIALYEYNVQLRQIHEDMELLMTEEPMTSGQLVGEHVKTAVAKLRNEGLIEHLYDYTWIMGVMNETDGMPSFDSPRSFLTYLASLGIGQLPDVSSIKKEYGRITGRFPNWAFLNKDKTESDRRVNVAKRFLNLYRKAG